MGYVGGFWLGCAVFIFMGIMLQHFELLTYPNAGFIGTFFIIFLILNILSWIGGNVKIGGDNKD